MSFLKLFPRVGTLCTAAMLLFCSAGCTGNSESAETSDSSSGSSVTVEVPEVTGDLTITTWKLGKADAFVIQTANSVTVVDTGLQGDGKKIQNFLEAQNIDTINNMIITHFDKDHVGGATRLLNRMKVETVFVPDYVGTVTEYQSFVDKAAEISKELTVLEAGSDYAWIKDDVTFRLLAAEETYYGKDEENDFSIALYMQHGENTFLFAGDAEEARQMELLSYDLGEVDFLKFPYHGHYLSVTESFLDYFKPSVTIVTCSKDEDADASTVETLETRGIEAYYTKNGDITVVCDGKTLQCTQTAS